MSEEEIQQQAFMWHWNTYVEERGLLFHVNNNAKNKMRGAVLKGMGVVRGVADLIFFRPGGRVVAIEVKAEGGSQKPDQKKWQALIESNGHIYILAVGLEATKEAILYAKKIFP